MKKISTTSIKIDDLNPASYNPRIMPVDEMNKLKKGLETHGLVDPIIIDLSDNNTVIGGHQRLEALKELNNNENITLTLIELGDIGLVIKDTDIKIKDKNDQKAINLSLNKITGDWDYPKLDEILLDLNNDHYDIELTGFDEDDIALTDFDIESLFDLEEDSQDNEEELPADYDDNVQGEQPNHRFSVYLSFEDRETANKYLEQLGVPNRMDKQTVLLLHGQDFTIE